MYKWFKEQFQSIFIRLAFVMILVAVAINVIIYQLFFSYQQQNETSFNRNLTQYAEFLTEALGTPPDKEKAQTLGDKLGMQVHYENKSQEILWDAGAPDEIHISPKYMQKWFSTPTLKVSSLHGYYRITKQLSPTESITFDIFPTQSEREAFDGYGWLLIGSTCGIILLAYAFIRFLLRPIRQLTIAAKAVRDGDLSHRVSTEYSGEFGTLSITFNEMVENLTRTLTSQKRLLLGVSHELRTPLTRLKLRLAMLPSCTQGEGMQRDLRHMETMITGLLEEARLEHAEGHLQCAQTDVAKLVHDVASIFDETKQHIQLSLPSDPILAHIDENRLRVVVGNLVENALKYSDSETHPVEVTLKTDENTLAIAVTDYGIGIAPEHHETIFEPFSRIDDSRTRETGGYGLGLSLCKAIVNAHKGTINVVSELGKGTTMTVELPR